MYKRIKKKLQSWWAKTSSDRYIQYLREKGVLVGHGCHIDPKTSMIDITRPSLVEIGDNVYMNSYFTLLTHDFVSGVFIHSNRCFLPSSGKVTIGNNCRFGRNVMILKGVSIGDNVFVGANSVVNKDIPSNSIAVGNPCKVVKSLEEFYQIRKEKCVEEAFIYARSIKERFGRLPVASDFWEEFPLFVDGKDVDSYPMIPIKRQLGPMYDEYCKSHKARFNGLNDFLKAAGIYEE